MTDHVVAQRHRLDANGGLRDAYLYQEEDDIHARKQHSHSHHVGAANANEDSPRPSSSLPSSVFAGQRPFQQPPPVPARPARAAPPPMTRNFSRPNHPYNSAASTLAPGDGYDTRRFSFDDDHSPGSSRPPSLSFSASRDSESHAEAPQTPFKSPTDLLDVQHPVEFGTVIEDDDKENGGNEKSGFVRKLRHAASSSGLSRSLTGKRSVSAKSGNAVPPTPSGELPPALRDEYDGDYFGQQLQAAQNKGNVRSASSSVTPSPDVLEKPLPPIGRDFEATRNRKASFGNRARPEYIDLRAPGGEKKKGKRNFLKTLIIGSDRSNDSTFLPPPPASAPAHATEFGEAALMARGSSTTSQGSQGGKAGRILGMNEEIPMSKADRLLGFNEQQRRRESRFMAELLAKRQDPLAEFAPDWKESRAPSRLDNFHSASTTAASSACSSPTGSEAPLPSASVSGSEAPATHHHHAESTSTEDSFTTASSSDSGRASDTAPRVSAMAPQLTDEISMHSRELSDELTEDINAVLRSQRNSFQKVDEIMAVHRQITKRNSSMRHHRKSSSTSSSRSAGYKPAVSSSLASSHQSSPASTHASLRSKEDAASTSPMVSSKHLPTSSISASEASVASTASSTRGSSTSTTSGSSRNQKWNHGDSTLLPASSATRPGLGLRYRTAHNIRSPPRSSVAGPPTSEPMARVCSEPMKGAGEASAAAAAGSTAAAGHPFAFPAVRPSLRMAKTSAILPQARGTTTRASRMLSDLPALSTLLHSCLLASKSTTQSPWYDLTHRPLCASSPKDRIPRSWSGYVRAYARGEFDLSQPPKPRSAPLVEHAVPRSSPNPAVERRARQTSLEDGPLDSLPKGIGLDFAFPLPPSRADGHEKGLETPGQHLNYLQVQHEPRRGSEATIQTIAAKSPLLDGATEDPEDTLQMEAEEVLAVGGMGDLKAPRPPYEAERQQATMQYLAALGIDGECRAASYQSSRLVAIVDRLAAMLSTRQASIQLVSDDEVISLAKSGQTFGMGDDEGGRTPRADDASSQRGMLGLDLFGSAAAVPLRDASLDAHAILSRHGLPVVVTDVHNDWRFSMRASSSDGAFFAAASIMSEDGLPIGTVSISDISTRPHGLTKHEQHCLAQASREVSAELEQFRRMALGTRLARLDESLASWSLQSEDAAEDAAPASWSPARQPLSIESTLLLAPLGSQAGCAAPPSPGTLAQRRGAKTPQSLAVPSARSQQHLPVAALRSALKTMVEALQMDLAYIAHVSPRPERSSSNAAHFQCSVIVQHDRAAPMPTVLRPDVGLHLCALAAPSKRGLHFQQDSARVSELLGRSLGSSNDALSGVFHTAAVVNCGLKGGVSGVQDGRIAKDTEGWVLCVASKSKDVRFAPESTIYLLRFASLLIPMLLESAAAAEAAVASSSPSPKWSTSPSGAASALPAHLIINGGRARSASRVGSTPSPPGGRMDAPLGPASSSSSSSSSSARPRCMSPGMRRGGGAPPPLSPPPNEPLPLLPSTPSPVIALRNLPSISGTSTSKAPPSKPPSAALPPIPPPRSTGALLAGVTSNEPPSSIAPSSTIDQLSQLTSLPSMNFADLGREWAGNYDEEGRYDDDDEDDKDSEDGLDYLMEAPKPPRHAYKAADIAGGTRE